MDVSRWQRDQVWIYRHAVDMRKSIDGLCAIVRLELGMDPNDGCVFVFCNRARDKLKLLIWHRNGYWLLYKRLDKQRFHWPDWFSHDAITLDAQQLDHLLDGYNLNGMRPHRHIRLAHVL